MTLWYHPPSKQSLFPSSIDIGIGHVNSFSQWIAADVMQGEVLGLLSEFGLGFESLSSTRRGTYSIQEGGDT